MRKIFLFLLIICLFSHLLASDEFLSTCIDIAIQRNKKLIAKEEEIVLAKRQTLVTTRSFLPNVYLQRKYSRGKTLTEEYQAEDLGLKLYQPLYDGGRLSASHRYYSLALQVAKLDYTKLKEEIIYKIKLAYYEYLSSIVEVSEIEEMFNEIDVYYRKLENEFTAKAISELELEEGKIFKQKVDNMYQKAKKGKILAEEKLIKLIGIKSLDDIIFPVPSGIFETVPKEIDFDLAVIKKLLVTNNVDLKKLDLNKDMAKARSKMAVGKIHPKFYLEGFYGKSGEAFVKEPLNLSTVYSGMLRLSWLLGGSSLESSYQKDKAIPREITDVSVRTENTVLDTRLGLFDDMKYFVEKKETDVLKFSSEAEYIEAKNVLLLESEKFYNEYYYSLLDARVNSSDLNLKKWRLDVLKKRNILYEVSTIEVMDGIFKVSEAVISYTRAVLQNYTAVTELEKLLLISLR